MMGHREKMKGDEYDAFTGWRKYLHWKPGQIRRIKRRFSKRVRRLEKSRLKCVRKKGLE